MLVLVLPPSLLGCTSLGTIADRHWVGQNQDGELSAIDVGSGVRRSDLDASSQQLPHRHLFGGLHINGGGMLHPAINVNEINARNTSTEVSSEHIGRMGAVALQGNGAIDGRA